MESCDNCFWKFKQNEWCAYSSERPLENTCSKHQYTCEECYLSEVEYEYKDRKLCFDCLLNELEIESYTVTHYTCKGEYIASEEDIEQVISEWDKDIKVIER